MTGGHTRPAPAAAGTRHEPSPDPRPHAALATDYDGTLARDGVVEGRTLAALGRLRAAGWRLVLATGRDLGALRALMPALPVFDRVVAEDGAVLHAPASGATRLLAPVLPPGFPARLRADGVSPLRVGTATLATWEVHEGAVAAAAEACGLRVRTVRNKGALTVLPPGVDKGTGLRAALAELGVPPARCVGVGDAENDLPLLAACGLPVAVANALPEVRRAARWVTRGERGESVAELADRLPRTGGFPAVPFG